MIINFHEYKMKQIWLHNPEQYIYFIIYYYKRAAPPFSDLSRPNPLISYIHY